MSDYVEENLEDEEITECLSKDTFDVHIMKVKEMYIKKIYWN